MYNGTAKRSLKLLTESSRYECVLSDLTVYIYKAFSPCWKNCLICVLMCFFPNTFLLKLFRISAEFLLDRIEKLLRLIGREDSELLRSSFNVSDREAIWNQIAKIARE